MLFTCVLLAKAGLVVGPLPPSVRPQHFMGAKFVQSVTPKVFIPFYSKLCLMIVHMLKMCTFYFVHVSFFLIFEGV